MIELIFILIVLEIIIGVRSLVRINNFTKKVSEANSELKASGFTGNISDLKNSLKKFNKQLKILKHQQMQETELNQVMNILNSIVLALPAIDWAIKLFSSKKKKIQK